MRHPSYKARAANACKQLPNALCPEDEWGAVLAVESFGATVSCVVADITAVQGDNP